MSSDLKKIGGAQQKTAVVKVTTGRCDQSRSCAFCGRPQMAGTRIWVRTETYDSNHQVVKIYCMDECKCYWRTGQGGYCPIHYMGLGFDITKSEIRRD